MINDLPDEVGEDGEPQDEFTDDAQDGEDAPADYDDEDLLNMLQGHTDFETWLKESEGLSPDEIDKEQYDELKQIFEHALELNK